MGTLLITFRCFTFFFEVGELPLYVTYLCQKTEVGSRSYTMSEMSLERRGWKGVVLVVVSFEMVLIARKVGVAWYSKTVEGSEGDWRHNLPSIIRKAYGGERDLPCGAVRIDIR